MLIRSFLSDQLASGQALGEEINYRSQVQSTSKMASKMDMKEFHRFNTYKRQYIEHKKSLELEQRRMVKVKKRIEGAEGEVKLFSWLIKASTH